MLTKVSIFWFRRDLRLTDNIGLTNALKGKHPVVPIFIFDKNITKQLPKDDARITFIFNTLQKIRKTLQDHHHSSLSIYYGTPEEIFKQLISKYPISEVHTNGDYEPYALQRDTKIENLLKEKQIPFFSYKDQVIFQKNEVVKSDGSPYVVYTPYKKEWKRKFDSLQLHNDDSQNYLGNLLKNTNLPNISLQEIAFIASQIKVTDYHVSQELIHNYEATRNIPSYKNGTSKLSPHLRFGTIGIRTLIKKAIADTNETFLSELIWREFFMQILWHFPYTKEQSFRPKYDRIVWRNDEDEFRKWTLGQTGYPLVDAGMRQLNQTGYMHNRVRMVVASFLCKHLLIDWRWGEAYFAEKLLDYDMAANVGNWQWAAGSGVDAAPYFRIFNPTTQITKFDPKHAYINTWIKDLNDFSYPSPIVEHKLARERCLKTFKTALQ
ncbi:deoxyribodipyrimidine photo-lyase [Aquimarina sp. 2201CG1-2-11]|uniref:cryptochrome/photolyase family protein n=1 Tax=Aquimarina discodermiae TaxID=3231043 RepID=UPI0034627AF5